jgi:hypothetical protein
MTLSTQISAQLNLTIIYVAQQSGERCRSEYKELLSTPGIKIDTFRDNAQEQNHTGPW